MKTIQDKAWRIINPNIQSPNSLVKWAAILGTAFFCFGCTHQLEVKNMSLYQNNYMNPLKNPMTIGIIPATDNGDAQQLIKGVGKALGVYSATVVLPYSPRSKNPADVVAKIQVSSEYKGSGWNFLINWPGFLIFAPAWHGYIYEANYQVSIMLTKGVDNSELDSWSMPINLDLRQAAINRTWTEVGWLEWGIIPLIGGIVFTSYDSNVTPMVIEKIENPIGDHIAQEIVQRINNSGEPITTTVYENKPAAGTK